MLLKKDDSLVLLVDVQEKLVPAISDSEAVIDRCAWVLKLANKMDVPVLARTLSKRFRTNNCAS